MNPLQKIRTSFTTQLTLWVACFVLVTAGVVFFLLGSYSQDVIHKETVDATQQLLENSALQIDNRLRQAEMTARLERQTLTVDRAMIERLVAENGYLAKLKQSLPHATLEVVEGHSEVRGEHSYSQPIGNRAFSLVTTYPASDIYSKFRRMQTLLFLGSFIGVSGLLLILFFVVSRHLRPFHILADTAQSIADGNLDTPIPDTLHEDETGRLQNSLRKMQHALKAYMDEMQLTQTTLSRQNAELQTAYGEAQAYETLKTKFVNDMTAQIAEPVKRVSKCTDSICHDYAKLTKGEMASRQMDIMQATETITQLLDRLVSEQFFAESSTNHQSIVGVQENSTAERMVKREKPLADAPAASLTSTTFSFSPFRYVRQHLSLRLGLVVTLVIAVVFSLLFDFLFYRCKRYIYLAAIDRATQLLDNTAERINGIMDETETVTNFMAHTTPRHLKPDSLLAFTRRTVQENTLLTGFAISMEPDFFPEMGRYYSAYTLRQDDTITTVREEPFEYFEKVWYKMPRTLGKACWTEAYDDYNEGRLSARDILTSYCCPLRDEEGRYVGSITASLTLKWLSEMVTAIPAYPHSSAIMLGHDGTYLVHPDTAKLFRESIFSDAAPEAQREIEAMGRAMIAGRSGMLETIVDGGIAYIFYRPLRRTGWSIAIVCPQSDVFARYNKLVAITWIVIGVSLLLLLALCYLIVRRAVRPLSVLDREAQRIAAEAEAGGWQGRDHGLQTLPGSNRQDSVGRLTNSFIRMQESVDKSVDAISHSNAQLTELNAQLLSAYRLKMETNRKKNAFIKEMYHEIRTPLNIICGFAQVLTISLQDIPADELVGITLRMKQSANDLTRLTAQLSIPSAQQTENDR